MKNYKIVAALLVLAVVFLSFRGVRHHKQAEQAEITSLFSDYIASFETQLANNVNFITINPNDITIVEVVEEVNLGFDAFEYLPIEFDAYAGMNLTDKDFEIFEEEEIVDLGFDTAAYLPADFNAYAL
tara:strand:+ start:1829 stop:2212 length:384 start_codon:yes stop_codon:yes gene_type:complete